MLDIQQEEEQEEREIGCLMVMADPSDLGHGKTRAWLGLRAGIKVGLRSADVIVMPPEEKSRDT